MKEIKKQLALWLRNNKENPRKNNLIAYLQDRICFYSNSADTPAEQIKGMNRLLRDLIRVEIEVFEVKD